MLAEAIVISSILFLILAFSVFSFSSSRGSLLEDGSVKVLFKESASCGLLEEFLEFHFGLSIVNP